MKKVAFFALIAIFMASCNNTNKQKQNQEVNTEENQEILIGGEKDEHGCLVAAGETWSELKQTCLQIFNEGKRLNPIEVKDGEAVISAFVLFNDDNSKAEIFLPSAFEKHNVILSKTADNTFEAENFKFDAQSNTLSFEGKEIYKAE